jgi:hypothetical protein
LAASSFVVIARPVLGQLLHPLTLGFAVVCQNLLVDRELLNKPLNLAHADVTANDQPEARIFRVGWLRLPNLWITPGSIQRSFFPAA